MFTPRMGEEIGDDARGEEGGRGDEVLLRKDIWVR